MKIKYCFIIISVLLSTVSCKTNNTNTDSNTDANIEDQTITNDSVSVVFQDSTNIGKKGNYKLEITQTYFENDDINTLLNITLFEKTPNGWQYIQNVKDSIQDVFNIDVELTDINNDGLLDFSYVYLLALRGFNDVRKHYIFDGKLNRLIGIKNSPQYPNLIYNEDLDCIESHIGHGGYTTVFLQLDNDSLKEFASIDLYDNKRIISITNKEGEETIISEISYDLDNEDSDMTYGDYDILSLKKYKN